MGQEGRSIAQFPHRHCRYFGTQLGPVEFPLASCSRCSLERCAPICARVATLGPQELLRISRRGGTPRSFRCSMGARRFMSRQSAQRLSPQAKCSDLRWPSFKPGLGTLPSFRPVVQELSHCRAAHLRRVRGASVAFQLKLWHNACGAATTVAFPLRVCVRALCSFEWSGEPRVMHGVLLQHGNRWTSHNPSAGTKSPRTRHTTLGSEAMRWRHGGKSPGKLTKAPAVAPQRQRVPAIRSMFSNIASVSI